jgi:hypothetical protein
MSESIFGFQVRAEQSFRQKLDAKDAELVRAKLPMTYAMILHTFVPHKKSHGGRRTKLFWLSMKQRRRR